MFTEESRKRSGEPWHEENQRNITNLRMDLGSPMIKTCQNTEHLQKNTLISAGISFSGCVEENSGDSDMSRPTHQWIQKAQPKHGALHRQLGYSPSEHIPPGLLNELDHAHIGNHVRGHTVTRLLKQRVVFAVNAQKRRK
jgi:hypothetical protein